MTSNGGRAKWTVEKLAADYDYIDALWFYRRGLLADKWVSFVPMLRWPRVSKIRASRYTVLVQWHDRPDPQQIRVSWTRCNLGGARPWIHCPCGRRVARLFKGLATYNCRQCFDNPRYASQSKSTQGRRHFEACKLRLRLGGIWERNFEMKRGITFEMRIASASRHAKTDQPTRLTPQQTSYQ
jgi:hypothetical protein